MISALEKSSRDKKENRRRTQPTLMAPLVEYGPWPYWWEACFFTIYLSALLVEIYLLINDTKNKKKEKKERQRERLKGKVQTGPQVSCKASPKYINKTHP